MKPTSSYLQNGGTIEIPYPLESLDHEVELAVVIGKKARDVPESTAMDYVGGEFYFIQLIFLVTFVSITLFVSERLHTFGCLFFLCLC